MGLVFDLARPETFDGPNGVDLYLKELRARAGNIPIILVGNKDDLMEDIGETVSREKILQKMNQYDYFEYIETSALMDHNVQKLFSKLSITSLLDFHPRRGEIIDDNHFIFKVLLAGPAAVGKSSLIKTFVKREFDADYKITVGLDFMNFDFEIPSEELPDDIHDIIKNALEIGNKVKHTNVEPKTTDTKASEESSEGSKKKEKEEDKEPSFLSKHLYHLIALFGIMIILGILWHLSFMFF